MQNDVSLVATIILSFYYKSAHNCHDQTIFSNFKGILTSFLKIFLALQFFMVAGCAAPKRYFHPDHMPANKTIARELKGNICLTTNHAIDSLDEKITRNVAMVFQNSVTNYIKTQAPKLDIKYVGVEDCTTININANRSITSSLADVTIKINNEIVNKLNVTMESQIETPKNIEFLLGPTQLETYYSDEQYNFGVVVGQKLLDTLTAEKKVLEISNQIKKEEELIEQKRKEEEAKKNDPRIIKEYTELVFTQISKEFASNPLKTSVQTYEKVIADGYKLDYLPNVCSKLLYVDENKLIEKVTPNILLPIEPINIKVEETINFISGQDKTILVQVMSDELNRNILEESEVKSKYVYDHKYLPNSEYAAATLEYESALSEYNNEKMKQSLNKQNSSSVGAAIFTGLANGISLAALSNKVNNAQAKLVNTPVTIKTPLEKEYHYNVMNIEITKNLIYKVYLIDPTNGEIWSKSFCKKDSKMFNLKYNKKTEDSGYNFTKYDEEKDAVEYENKKQSLSTQEIIDNLVDSDLETFEKLTLVNLTKTLKDDQKTKAMASAITNNSSNVEDNSITSLMDSVVAIQNNGGKTIGTGFFVTENLIMTNRHVVEKDKIVSLKTRDKRKHVGKVIDIHFDLDVALLSVEAKGKPITFNSEDSIKEGDDVVAIGNPIGLEYSVTKGIISGIRQKKNKNIPLSKDYRYIQTDVPINPGNSGGPLYKDGKIIGMNTLKISDEDIEGIGFAIHYEDLQAYLNEKNIFWKTTASPILVKNGEKSKGDENQYEKLQILKKMIDNKLISKEDYEAKKQDILRKL